MATLNIEFEWLRGHAYEAAKDPEGKRVIRQIGRGRDRFRPLEISPALYLTFAALDGSPEACVGFAQLWGLLTTPAHVGAAEPHDAWQREIKRMKSLISMARMVRTANSRRIRLVMTSIEVALLSGELDAWDAKPALVLQPRTLIDAMIVQLAQSRASGNSLQNCEQCGRWFEIGASAKRNVAKFCSDRCRNRHHYERRIEK